MTSQLSYTEDTPVEPDSVRTASDTILTTNVELVGNPADLGAVGDVQVVSPENPNFATNADGSGHGDFSLSDIQEVVDNLIAEAVHSAAINAVSPGDGNTEDVEKIDESHDHDVSAEESEQKLGDALENQDIVQTLLSDEQETAQQQIMDIKMEPEVDVNIPVNNDTSDSEVEHIIEQSDHSPELSKSIATCPTIKVELVSDTEQLGEGGNNSDGVCDVDQSQSQTEHISETHIETVIESHIGSAPEGDIETVTYAENSPEDQTTSNLGSSKISGQEVEPSSSAEEVQNIAYSRSEETELVINEDSFDQSDICDDSKTANIDDSKEMNNQEKAVDIEQTEQSESLEVEQKDSVLEDSLIPEENTSAESPRLNNQQKDAIKEPEESSHREECALLQENQSVSSTQSSQESKQIKAEEMKQIEIGKTEQTEQAEETKQTEQTGETDEQKDGWLYILGHDKLKKKVLQVGDGVSTRPMRGQQVTVFYQGTLLGSTVAVDGIDSYTYVLGDGDVIQALELAVPLMELNEVCTVVTEARFAYGDVGREPNIPKGATLEYRVKLLNVEPEPNYASMPISERVRHADGKRERGNFLYARGEFALSVNSYTKSLGILDDRTESHNEEADQLQLLVDARVKCYNNLAAAQLKIEAWSAALKSCESVLRVQPENVKALFRKGKCLGITGDIKAAISCLKTAVKLEPETKIIHQELSKLMKRLKSESDNEKNLYQKMLGTDKEPFIKKKNNKFEKIIDRGGKQIKSPNSTWMWYIGAAAAAALVSVGLAVYRYIHV